MTPDKLKAITDNLPSYNTLEACQHALREGLIKTLNSFDRQIVAIIIVDKQSAIQYANPAAGELIGSPLEQLIGRRFPLPYKEGNRIECEYQRSPDDYRSLEVISSEAQWGEEPAVLILLRDITERKRAVESLAQERNLLQTLIDNIPDLIFIKDRNCRYLLGNLAWKQLAGVKELEEIGGKTDYDFYPPQVADQYHSNDKEVLESGKPLINVEEPNVYPDGSQAWTLISKIPFQSADGSLIGLIGIGRDITERKHTEQMLLNERKLLETLMNNLPDSVFIKDTQSRFILGNATVCQIVGVHSSKDLEGKTDFDFFPRELAQRYFEDEQELVNTGQPLIDHEEPVAFANGTWRWFWTTKTPIVDHNGKIEGIIGIGRDITERKRMEEALEQERTLMRTLIDNIPASVYIKDTSYRKILANNADLLYMGKTSEAEILGKTDFEIFPQAMASQFFLDDQKVIEGGKAVMDHEEVIYDDLGKEHWLSTSKLPLRDGNGDIIGLLGIGKDITERKLMEQVLERERSLLRMLIDSLPDNIYVKDVECRKLLANRADVLYMGFENEAEVIGKTDFDVYPPQLAEHFYRDDKQVLESGIPIIEREEPVYNVEGKQRWLLTSKFPLRNANGEIVGILGIGRDISARKKAERELLQAYEQLEQRVQERTAELAKINSELRNEIAERKRLQETEMRRVRELEALRATMTDISAELELSNLLQAIVDRLITLLGADFGELALYDESRQDLETVVGGYEEIDFRGERTNMGEGALGRTAITLRSLIIENYSSWEGRLNLHENLKPFTLLYSPLLAGQKLLGVVGVGADINKRKFTKQDVHLIEMFAQQASIAIQNAHLFREVQRLAVTDPLTGLYNRRYFMERASNEFKRAKRYLTPLSVIMLDIDHFKQVNDTYGHLAGDQVLQNLAKLCQSTLRAVDIIGRYGGEEFMVMLPETPLKKAQHTAERLRSEIAAHTTRFDEHVIRITASMGVAEVCEQTESLDALLDQTDRALYNAKGSGRNKVVLCETSPSKLAER